MTLGDVKFLVGTLNEKYMCSLLSPLTVCVSTELQFNWFFDQFVLRLILMEFSVSKCLKKKHISLQSKEILS